MNGFDKLSVFVLSASMEVSLEEPLTSNLPYCKVVRGCRNLGSEKRLGRDRDCAISVQAALIASEQRIS